MSADMGDDEQLDKQTEQPIRKLQVRHTRFKGNILIFVALKWYSNLSFFWCLWRLMRLVGFEFKYLHEDFCSSLVSYTSLTYLDWLSQHWLPSAFSWHNLMQILSLSRLEHLINLWDYLMTWANWMALWSLLPERLLHT